MVTGAWRELELQPQEGLPRPSGGLCKRTTILPCMYIYIYICQPQTIKASNKNPPSLTKGSGEGHPNKTTTFRQEPGQPNKRPYPSRASEGRMSSLGGPSQKSRTRCSNHHSFQPGWWEKKKMYGTQSVAESTVLSEPTNKSRKCLHHFGVTGLK